MADIQIVYRVGYCVCDRKDYCVQCHTCVADDLGCEYYCPDPDTDENGRKVIPFGDCNRAMFKYIYKGWTGKRYEIEESRDDYNPHLDCMIVTLGQYEYECVKVVLDGKCIFNEYDDDRGDENDKS